MELEMLKKVVSEVLNVDPKEIMPQTTFVDDLGADSLDLLQVVMGIEEVFNIKFEEEDLYKIVSVEDALSLIKSLTGTL